MLGSGLCPGLQLSSMGRMSSSLFLRYWTLSYPQNPVRAARLCLSPAHPGILGSASAWGALRWTLSRRAKQNKRRSNRKGSKHVHITYHTRTASSHHPIPTLYIYPCQCYQPQHYTILVYYHQFVLPLSIHAHPLVCTRKKKQKTRGHPCLRSVHSPC